MEIFAYGADHWRTPLVVRERLTQADLLGLGIYGLMAAEVLSEALVISTCNRLEIVGVGPLALKARDGLRAELARVANLPLASLDQYFHYYENEEAARYLFRVAAGLESQVLGEPQILGQVKDSFREALKRRTVGPVVGKLLHKSFRAAKRARTETELAQGTVSVASAAVEAADRLVGGLKGLRALILGAGEMAALAAAHLADRELRSLTIVNRTLAKAESLAAAKGARARPWAELGEALVESDLVFTALGGAEPALTKKSLAAAGLKGKVWLFDLGVPRNVESRAKEHSGVVLVNIDEIAGLVEASQRSRRREVAKVEAIIEEELEKFRQWLKCLGARPTIKALTALAEEARGLELEKTLAKHEFSADQSQAIETMSRALVRRILHNPLAFAKTCHRHGRVDYNLDMVRRIFGLDPR
ncbi:MAG: glutamyl-tRNA reductase [Deltaproteobacteria bacterium]|jgi:glutamyl-tRNA reductase|nr:glutamyl-tRNA reductase [Deltaproteobacteria bacterium]